MWDDAALQVLGPRSQSLTVIFPLDLSSLDILSKYFSCPAWAFYSTKSYSGSLQTTIHNIKFTAPLGSTDNGIVPVKAAVARR